MMSGLFVLHSLRNTYGIRLGEAGADASRRLSGRPRATANQRCFRLTPKVSEKGVERLAGLNQKETEKRGRDCASACRGLRSKVRLEVRKSFVGR